MYKLIIVFLFVQFQSSEFGSSLLQRSSRRTVSVGVSSNGDAFVDFQRFEVDAKALFDEHEKLLRQREKVIGSDLYQEAKKEQSQRHLDIQKYARQIVEAKKNSSATFKWAELAADVPPSMRDLVYHEVEHLEALIKKRDNRRRMRSSIGVASNGISMMV